MPPKKNYPKKMKVKVTRKHIDNGLRQNKSACPIALAIREITHRSPVVGAGEVLVRRRNNRREKTWYYNLPSSAIDFICRFDKYGPVAVRPFTFTMTPQP